MVPWHDDPAAQGSRSCRGTTRCRGWRTAPRRRAAVVPATQPPLGGPSGTSAAVGMKGVHTDDYPRTTRDRRRPLSHLQRVRALSDLPWHRQRGARGYHRDLSRLYGGHLPDLSRVWAGAGGAAQLTLCRSRSAALVGVFGETWRPLAGKMTALDGGHTPP